MDFTDKACIVTGANTGPGFEVAKRLATRGAPGWFLKSRMRYSAGWVGLEINRDQCDRFTLSPQGDLAEFVKSEAPRKSCEEGNG